jgi:hypothetical protein
MRRLRRRHAARAWVPWTNHGPDSAADVTVSDPVNQQLVTVASLPAACVLRSGTITCHVGTLAAGQAKTFRITAVARADLVPGTLIDNCATVPGTPGRSCTQAKVNAPKPPPVPVTG